LKRYGREMLVYLKMNCLVWEHIVKYNCVQLYFSIYCYHTRLSCSGKHAAVQLHIYNKTCHLDVTGNGVWFRIFSGNTKGSAFAEFSLIRGL